MVLALRGEGFNLQWSAIRPFSVAAELSLQDLQSKAESLSPKVVKVPHFAVEKPGFLEVSQARRGLLYLLYVGNVMTSLPRIELSAERRATVREPMAIPAGLGLLVNGRGKLVAVSHRRTIFQLFREVAQALDISVHRGQDSRQVSKSALELFEGAERILYCLHQSDSGRLSSFSEGQAGRSSRPDLTQEQIVYFSCLIRVGGVGVHVVVSPKAQRFSLRHSGSPFGTSHEMMKFLDKMELV